MAYVTVNEVRDMTDLTVDDINDKKLSTLTDKATEQLNGDINVRRWGEEFEYIDDEKENKLDSSNKTFYVMNPPIGDKNNDGKITTNDIEVYGINANGNRTHFTVDSINTTYIDKGEITLATAPGSDLELYSRYYQAPLDENTPHALIKQACVYLTTAIAYTKIQMSDLERFKIRDMQFTKTARSFEIAYSNYNRVRNKILSRMSNNVDGKELV